MMASNRFYDTPPFGEGSTIRCWNAIRKSNSVRANSGTRTILEHASCCQWVGKKNVLVCNTLASDGCALREALYRLNV